MNFLRSAVLGFTLLLGMASTSFAEDFKVPALSGPVVDEANWLSDGDRSRLDEVLREIHRQGKAQIAVYIASSLQGYDIETASIQVAEAWKLGKKGVDNGVLLFVAPNEHRMRIEVGYGLEGVLTDALTRRIQERIIKPAIRDGRQGDGIYNAVVKMGELAGTDFSSVPQARNTSYGEGQPGKISVPLIIFLFFIFIRFSVAAAGIGSALGLIAYWFTGVAILGFIIFFVVGVIASLFFGGRYRPWYNNGGGWGGGGFGGFGGGGFGGGGFGGGGGSFGGGGSSSSW